MADEPRRTRMSRHVSLVLLTSLPGLAACGGCDGREPTEEVEEVTEQPPPDGPAHVIGAPFVAWWQATHPPVVARRTVPRSALAAGGYSRGGSRVYYRPLYGGRSAFLSGGSSYHGPANAAPVTRGGFGSTGHAAAGG
ncbi:MAG TPA: hypothetical protein VKE40_26370 [Gemmataceae bacterium]|nr:hypothetical protein [Gemmataceae bacterium]